MANKARLAGIVSAGVLSIAAMIIGPHEGRSLVAYLDPVGVPTICEGVTAGVELGDVATNAECDAALEREMRVHLAGIEPCIDGYLTPNQWAAVLSWAYNVGSGAACGSTLVAQVNDGYDAAVWCQQLLRWTYAGGRQLHGLVRRREAEYRLCLGEA